MKRKKIRSKGRRIYEDVKKEENMKKYRKKINPKKKGRRKIRRRNRKK